MDKHEKQDKTSSMLKQMTYVKLTLILLSSQVVSYDPLMASYLWSDIYKFQTWSVGHCMTYSYLDSNYTHFQILNNIMIIIILILLFIWQQTTVSVPQGEWRRQLWVFICLHSCSRSRDEMDAHVCANVRMLDSLCPSSVYTELTGASRVASRPPSACTSSPFEALKQCSLGMINGPAEWHAPQLSFRPPASSPAVPPPDTASSVTTPLVRPHTTRFLGVTYPTFPRCHLPPTSPLKKALSSSTVEETLSSFSWYHPSCCAVNTGVFLLEDKGNKWQPAQL